MITIVSGLPRSGTSLMMQILEKMNIPILTDFKRKKDENNPRGYYEYEKTKKLMSDNSWLQEAEGKAVKIIIPLINFLPENFEYRIILMNRNIEEIIQSQNKMTKNLGTKPKFQNNDSLKTVFQQQLSKTKKMIKAKKNIKFHEVSFHNLFNNKKSEISKLSEFLELDSKIDNIQKVIEPKLYRTKLMGEENEK